MSCNISLLAEVDDAYRRALELPPSYTLTEENYKDIEECHAKWVKAGGVSLLGRREQSNRTVFNIVKGGASKQRASYMYKDRTRKFVPASMLPEIMALLPGAAPASAPSTAPGTARGTASKSTRA